MGGNKRQRLDEDWEKVREAQRKANEVTEDDMLACIGFRKPMETESQAHRGGIANSQDARRDDQRVNKKQKLVQGCFESQADEEGDGEEVNE